MDEIERPFMMEDFPKPGPIERGCIVDCILDSEANEEYNFARYEIEMSLERLPDNAVRAVMFSKAGECCAWLLTAVCDAAVIARFATTRSIFERPEQSAVAMYWGKGMQSGEVVN